MFNTMPLAMSNIISVLSWAPHCLTDPLFIFVRLMVFQQYFSYIVEDSSIGGGTQYN
jgi:hypothetical protein